MVPASQVSASAGLTLEPSHGPQLLPLHICLMHLHDGCRVSQDPCALPTLPVCCLFSKAKAQIVPGISAHCDGGQSSQFSMPREHGIPSSSQPQDHLGTTALTEVLWWLLTAQSSAVSRNLFDWWWWMICNCLAQHPTPAPLHLPCSLPCP